MATGVFEGTLPEEEAFSFSLTDAAGIHQIDFYRVGEEGEDFVATSSRQNGAFDVAAYIAEQLDVTLEDLGPDDVLENVVDVTEDSIVDSSPDQ